LDRRNQLETQDVVNSLPNTGDRGRFLRDGYSLIRYCLSDLAGNERLVRHRIGKENMYYHQARHCVSFIQGKAKCLSTGEDAIKAVAVGEAVLKSARGMQARNVSW